MISRDTGVESNHSSLSPSTHHSENSGHPQADDTINAGDTNTDPNIAGHGEMRTPYTWLSGKIDGWCENDDYREYFENSRGCDGMLGHYDDGDYDDNGGMAVAIGHHRGHHGSNSISHGMGIIVGRL